MAKRDIDISPFGKLLKYMEEPGFMMKAKLGFIEGVSVMEKFGENPAVGTSFETITDIGGTYAAPTEERIHNVASDDVADVGSIVESGIITGGSNTVLNDSLGLFVTNVTVGDYVINDTDLSIGIITSIDSNSQVTVNKMASPTNGMPLGENNVGDSYRIVHAAGTGASIFFVMGLDGSFNQTNEFVVLNGTTDVPTVNKYFRQFRAKLYNAGSGLSGVGNITSTAVTDGTVTCTITIGNNQTLMTVYTIPNGKVGLLHNWNVSLSKKTAASVVARLRLGNIAGMKYTKRTVALNSTGTSYFNADILIALPGGSDILIEANASAETGVSAGFNVLLFDNDIWGISN